MDECEKIATSRLLHRDLYDWEKSLVEYYQRFGVPAELMLDEALRLSYRVTVDWVDSMLNGKTLTIEEKTIIKSLLNLGKTPREIATHILACRRDIEPNQY